MKCGVWKMKLMEGGNMLMKVVFMVCYFSSEAVESFERYGGGRKSCVWVWWRMNLLVVVYGIMHETMVCDLVFISMWSDERVVDSCIWSVVALKNKWGCWMCKDGTWIVMGCCEDGEW